MSRHLFVRDNLAPPVPDTLSRSLENTQRTPTLYQSVGPSDTLEDDNNSSNFDLPYLVRASNPPPVVRDVQHPTLDESTRQGYSLDHFRSEYSPTDSYPTDTTSPFTAVHSYGPVNTGGLYESFPFQFNTPQQCYDQFPEINYQSMQGSQMNHDQRYESDNRPSQDGHSFY
jgi:hypothetical protein